MQVLCMVSKGDEADVACPLCGSAYKLYYSRMGKSEREVALRSVRLTLVEHHRESGAAQQAHPPGSFNVPAWRGDAHASAAAVLSGAPVENSGAAGLRS